MAGVFVDLICTLFVVYKALVIAFFRFIFGGREKSVAGEKILITGAGSGLGRLMALDFAQRGAEIIAWDINKPGNEETAKMIRDKGGKAHAYTVDIRYVI